MSEQEKKDTLSLLTTEKENRMNINALVEHFKDLQIKYEILNKNQKDTEKRMEMLNNNFAQVQQRVNTVAATTMGTGPTS